MLQRRSGECESRHFTIVLTASIRDHRLEKAGNDTSKAVEKTLWCIDRTVDTRTRVDDFSATRWKMIRIDED